MLLNWCFGDTANIIMNNFLLINIFAFLRQINENLNLNHKCMIVLIWADFECLEVNGLYRTWCPAVDGQVLMRSNNVWWHQTWLWTCARCQSHEDKDVLSIMLISLCGRYHLCQCRGAGWIRAVWTSSVAGVPRMLDCLSWSNATP